MVLGTPLEVPHENDALFFHWRHSVMLKIGYLKFVFGQCNPDPTWGAHDAPQTPKGVSIVNSGD